MKVQLKALKPFAYAGRRISVGDIFFANGRSDAAVLKAIGNAESYAAPAPAAKPKIEQVQVATCTVAAPIAEAPIKQAPAKAAESEAAKPAPVAITPRTKRPFRRDRLVSNSESDE